ncbi:MAG: hypothetical protein ABI378_06915 [Chitinophagaceae bacterium]
MKSASLLLLISLCVYICNGQSNEDLKIPEKATSFRTANSQQLPGTRIFLTPPNGFNLVQQLIRFQKNDSTFIQVFEIPGSAFDLQGLTTKIEEDQQSGRLAKEYYKKTFQFGPYQALFFYGPDTHPGREQMLLSFGDKSFAIMVIGELPAADKIAREEVVKAMLTTFVDTSIISDPTQLATCSLDVEGTEFKYVGNISQTYFYNYRAKPLDNSDEFANQISVSTLPAQSKSALKEFGKSMIERYKMNGMKIPEYKDREFILNGNYAYEITFDGSFNDRVNSVYQIVTSNESSSAALFLGSTYDDRENILSQIKQVAESLRLK